MDRLGHVRLIEQDGVSDSFGLAADECVAGRVGGGRSQPTLRLYTYSGCALVGRFQNVYSELHVEHCEQAGIPLNRRPTGGGAIVMGPEQLGIALMVPGAARDSFLKAREAMTRFAECIVSGLGRLGVRAEFKGKNDLEVDGRKLAGLGIFRHASGGLLFHASVLVGLDVGYMLSVLNTPFEKITDKVIATVASRTSTVRSEARGEPNLDEVRRAVGAGFAEVLQTALAPGTFSGEESAEIAKLEQEKYLTRDWVYQQVEVSDAFGAAKVKTPEGLLDIRVTLAGKMMKAVFIGGDFIAADNAVASLEAGLRWHVSEPAAVAATVERLYAERPEELAGIPLPPLLQAIEASVAQANSGEGDASLYGCFVNPQA